MKTFTLLETNEKSSGALRGNMGGSNFLERSSGSKIQVGLTRTETIRQVREARPATFQRRKNHWTRVARIKKLPSINGFHVVGLGNVPQITLNELKAKLGVQGYTAMKFGGLPVRS